MGTPKGISSQHVKVLNGDAVHIYNDNGFIVLQLRSETPTTECRLGQSFKVGVGLSPADAAKVAAVLLEFAAKQARQVAGDLVKGDAGKLVLAVEN